MVAVKLKVVVMVRVTVGEAQPAPPFPSKVRAALPTLAKSLTLLLESVPSKGVRTSRVLAAILGAAAVPS
jgi:hypothetical protein